MRSHSAVIAGPASRSLRQLLQRAVASNRYALALVITSFSSAALPASEHTDSGHVQYNRSLYTNETFIRDLYDYSLRIDRPLEVYAFVFSKLPEHITVIPSEHYYYFKFASSGREFVGAIQLLIHRDNRNEIVFSYRELVPQIDNSIFSTYDTYFAARGGARLTEKDGLKITPLGPNRYAVSYNGKEVVFDLRPFTTGTEGVSHFDVSLAKGEILVGRSFDESGLSFFLVFDLAHNSFYWILDESSKIVDQLIPLSERLLVGLRTKFVFYSDPAMDRRMLIAVEKSEVEANSWYDGPFDQLPYRDIRDGKISDLQDMLVAAGMAKYQPGVTSGKVNEYGQFIDTLGTRTEIAVSISPYRQYNLESLKDVVRFVEGCERQKGADYIGLRYCITATDH